MYFNSRNERLTRPGVTCIINKYADICRIQNKEFYKEKITPHIFRRSKATHLLENDINIYYIRDFLGHESIVTTEMYARTNTELLAKAIMRQSQKIEIKQNTKFKNDDMTISTILDRFK